MKREYVLQYSQKTYWLSGELFPFDLISVWLYEAAAV